MKMNYDPIINGTVTAVELYDGKNGTVMSKLALAFGGVDTLPWQIAQKKYAKGITAYTVMFDKTTKPCWLPTIRLFLRYGYQPLAEITAPCIDDRGGQMCFTVRWDNCKEREQLFKVLKKRAELFGVTDDVIWNDERFQNWRFDDYVRPSEVCFFTIDMVNEELLDDAEDIDMASIEHENKKVRHSRRRKDAFRAGTRRKRVYDMYNDVFAGSLRDGFNKGHFQEGKEYKEVYGKHSNSKKCKSVRTLRQLDSAATQFSSCEEDSIEYSTTRNWDYESERNWADWSELRHRIQYECGLTDSEMADISCTESLYLGAKYKLGNWKMPAPNSWTIRRRRFPELWEMVGVSEEEYVPTLEIGGTCRKAESMLCESMCESLFMGY